MNAREILDANFEIKEGSFLYYLQNKQTFRKEAFRELYESIKQLSDENVGITDTARKINFVYGQVLKCFMYHFDVADAYKIAKLPPQYNKILQLFENNVFYYFQTRI